MARSGQQEAHRRLHRLRHLPDRAGRRDMVFPACLHIAWRHDLSEADRRAGDADLAAHELVVAVEVEIGSASCRESVCQYVSIPVVAVSLKQHTTPTPPPPTHTPP